MAEAELFRVAAAIAPTFAGGPALDYQGQVAGMVVGTNGPDAVCLPIRQVARILGKQ